MAPDSEASRPLALHGTLEAPGGVRLLLHTQAAVDRAIVRVLERADPRPSERAPCAEFEMALSAIGQVAGCDELRVGKASALLRALGLTGLSRRLSRLSQRRRGAAHPDAPFLDDLKRAMDTLPPARVSEVVSNFRDAELDTTAPTAASNPPASSDNGEEPGAEVEGQSSDHGLVARGMGDMGGMGGSKHTDDSTGGMDPFVDNSLVEEDVIELPTEANDGNRGGEGNPISLDEAATRLIRLVEADMPELSRKPAANPADQSETASGSRRGLEPEAELRRSGSEPEATLCCKECWRHLVASEFTKSQWQLGHAKRARPATCRQCQQCRWR
mmetsp:Transcript_128360/g.399509  ORF Transcript_128360/g.399509 Transcript_128360/m.399509 type:complete len:330 (-) Transcript_128360:163-1152(-)